jgi:hypothetical protein
MYFPEGVKSKIIFKIITKHNIKQRCFSSVYVCLDHYNFSTDCDAVFLIDTGFQKEDLYVYKMHNIVEKNFSTSIASEAGWIASL